MSRELETRSHDDDFASLIPGWSGHGVFVHHDETTGTWIFVALHSARLGRPSGGSRMKVYPGLRHALRDAMRLAEGMTSKWAGIGVPFGGGKAVLAVPEIPGGDERRDLMRRYGDLIESLAGAFATGADLGTTAEDMAVIAERTGYVLGVDHETGESTDPGPFTARGVFEGLRAAVAHVFGSDDLTGRSVVVQGIGGVGGPLARLLTDAGAEVLLSDLDRERLEALAGEIGAEILPAEKALERECDVFAPCAVGGVLNEETIPTLGCRIVAGSANNQLREDADAERLRARGIVYAPDWVINAGGALAFALLAEGIDDHDELMSRVARIGDAVGEILAEAEETEITTLAAAKRRVERRLED